VTRSVRVARWVVVVAFAAVAFGGALVGVHDRERDDAFVEGQLNPTTVSRPDVERAIALKTGDRPATCTATEAGALRNPWTCRAGGVRYQVTIAQNGAFVAAGGGERLRDCCIPVPVVR